MSHRSARSPRLRSVLSSRPVEILERRLLFAVVNVDTVAELVTAVNSGAAGDTVNVAAGTYQLTAPLTPKINMTIQGVGSGTILRNASTWVPGTAALPDVALNEGSVNTGAYLFNLGTATTGVKILNMKLTGPQLHGAVYGNNCDGLEVGNVIVDDFLWSGIRTFRMDNARIHDSTFINAGGRWKAGAPATSGGITGGAIHVDIMGTSEIDNNRFYRTNTGAERNFYGIKGNKAVDSRIHHNTIETDFSIEFAHQNDQRVEIDHNWLKATVSIPKKGNGAVPADGSHTFHIHHNYFKYSYSLEWSRNNAEVDHNLFDFSTGADAGNLITNFGVSSEAVGSGWTRFHNNLIKNPGRGLYNSNGHVYNSFSFYNNHVIGNTTVTPRTEGLFGFPAATTFSTIQIKDNIFEMNGTSRPLFKNTAGYASAVSNNTLTGITDTANYSNPNTGATRGPAAPLSFTVGVGGEYTINGWNIAPTPTGIGIFTATQDVGAVAAAGSASHSSGTYTVSGSGIDIGGNADEFRYLFTSVGGDVTLTARVTSQTNTNAAAKAGVMIRESLDANARNIFVGVMPSSGLRFSRRTSIAASTSGTNVTGIAAPYWLRVRRVGSSFSAYHSSDGSTWTQVGVTVSMAMTASAYVGLAVTSKLDGTLGTATFDNVSLTQPLTATSTASIVGRRARPAPAPARVAALAKEAARRLAARGVSTDLSNVRFFFGNLSDGRLAETNGRTITLDDDAAGHGWFVDPTPADDREFSRRPPRGIDLLSVLAHELGHVAGLDHADDGVMMSTLSPRTRSIFAPA